MANNYADREPQSANEYWLKQIAQNGGGSGGGLPPVTEADNGDFLGVVDGAWSKTDAPSGLPAYTSADEGKVLTVGEDADHPVESVVIPEQTVTTVQGNQYCYATVEGSTIDWSNVKSGDSIKLTINGTDYQAAYDAVTYGIPAFIATSGGTPVAAIGFVGDQITFLTTTTGDYTIKAISETPGVKTVWGGIPLVVYDELDGQRMKTLTVSKAAELYSKGYIIYTHGSNGNIRLLTNITAGSTSGYNIYYDFNSTATFTNVSGDSKVPVIQMN